MYAPTADEVVFTIAVDGYGANGQLQYRVMNDDCGKRRACGNKRTAGRMNAVCICTHSYRSALADAWQLLAR